MQSRRVQPQPHLSSSGSERDFELEEDCSLVVLLIASVKNKTELRSKEYCSPVFFFQDCRRSKRRQPSGLLLDCSLLRRRLDCGQEDRTAVKEKTAVRSCSCQDCSQELQSGLQSRRGQEVKERTAIKERTAVQSS